MNVMLPGLKLSPTLDDIDIVEKYQKNVKTKDDVNCESKMKPIDPCDKQKCLPCNPIHDKIFWAYMLIAVVISVIVASGMYTNTRNGWYDFHRGNSDWNISMSREGLVTGWVAFIFLISIVAYLGYYQAHNQHQRNTNNLVYGAIIFFAILYPIVFFLWEAPELATLIGLLMIGLVIWWIGMIKDICRQTIIVLPLIISILWLVYNMAVSVDIYYAIEKCPIQPVTIGGPGGFFPA